MERRNFVKSGLAFSAAAATPAFSFTHSPQSNIVLPTEEYNFNLKYAPHAGMFKHHAGDSIIDQINFMADVGFKALEDNGMMGRDVAMQEKIAQTMQQRGMEMGVFVIDKGGNGANTLAAGKPEHEKIFLDGCRRAVDVAKRVNATWMTVVPGDFQRDIPIGIQTANVIETLRKAAEIFEPEGLVMVLEPLSDSPNLFLRTSDQTYLICRAVNSPACKILFDVYHMQKNEGHIINNMDLTWDEIAYVQVGDKPGRKEPTTGEINYKNIFKYLYDKGYEGIIGMEHGNFAEGEAGEDRLIEAYKEVDSFKEA